jgi:hypothetical protein
MGCSLPFSDLVEKTGNNLKLIGSIYGILENNKGQEGEGKTGNISLRRYLVSMSE